MRQNIEQPINPIVPRTVRDQQSCLTLHLHKPRRIALWGGIQIGAIRCDKHQKRRMRDKAAAMRIKMGNHFLGCVGRGLPVNLSQLLWRHNTLVLFQKYPRLP
ncbi:hypothetical protein SHM7688_03230 [Shimia marina]|uniref:Uncharacterized protein n=1 Tax=Shimia marina TaxID=321267 RepID=A0A0P1ET75_9RHOB|nr:hypothetical protein SHM7688_03230 [Shimia marina]